MGQTNILQRYNKDSNQWTPFTKNPPQKRSQQGDPLSSLLYVLVIEMLALQLRTNPNIVGFTIEGKIIISLHYADDAIITIQQNQCFKEVFKDLKDYELATGAKINYSKTKGLWVGKWKNRQDKPLNIEWTNENVKTLGIYFGNKKPGNQTFEEILPEVKKSMNHWKQFRLSKFAKARVVEIFHASRLWYASTFYPIPLDIQKQLQTAFFDYINFPRQANPTVSQQEMTKLRLDGGIKLTNLQTKSETLQTTFSSVVKIKWLMELTTTPHLHTHLSIMTSLIGTQKGGLRGCELFFTNSQYSKKILKLTHSSFYSEAVQAITKIQVQKRIENLEDEKVFYNPIFKDSDFKTIPITLTCERNGIYTYGQVSSEYVKQQNGAPHNKHIANIHSRIVHTNLIGKSQNTMYNTQSQNDIPFKNVTHKDIYCELIRLNYKEHHSKKKWEEKFINTDIIWPTVWVSVNNPISTEDTKTIIWEQIHLNDYNTYSYNKWHKTQQECPLCLQIPQSKFHLTLECHISTKLWEDLEFHLRQIHPAPITNTEKVFGLHGNTPNVILRN